MALTHPPLSSEATLENSTSIADEVYVMPASVAQQRFWLLEQLEPGNTSLNMPLALRLSGDLDISALEQTLNEIVARHEVLRTTFMIENDELVQVILRETRLNLDAVDISDLSAADREERAGRLMIDEAHIAFDLAQGPLFKAKVLTLGGEDHILLLTLHHIICDGWSNGVLVRELGEIYDALSKGQPASLAELPIQYGDFALWQQEWLKSNAFDEQLEYWQRQLGNELPTLEMPTNFPRRKNRTSYGAIESLLIPQPLTRALKALSRREDVTLFTIFLAAFKVLLHRYSHQNSILVGSPTANRIQGQTEGLIGAFANTLLLKTDLCGDHSFRETLQRVKEVSLGALLNQTLPFEKLVEQIKPAQSRNSAQLFQVLFVFQTAFMQPVKLSDLTLTPMRSVSPGSIFELSLGVVERAEGTRLQLEYNTDLFEADTIKGILGNLQSILQSAVTDIRGKISDIVLPTAPLALLSAIDGQSVRGTDAASQVIADVPGVGPRDQVEATLVEIWEEVLDARPVGIWDDFFELGGHSLLAARVISRIRETFQISLPLRALFEMPTVASLAARLEGLPLQDASPEIPAITPVARDRKLPLSFAQQQLWLVDQFDPHSLAYNQPRGFRLLGRLNSIALRQSFSEMVARHEILRTTFVTDNGTPVQVIAPVSSFDLPIIDLSSLAESEREARTNQILDEAWRGPFDLSAGPLLRAILLRLASEEHVLLTTTHHIINDGWSMGVFLRELSAFYNALTVNSELRLAELPIQYADFARWQRQSLSGTALEKPLAYWRRKLQGAPEVIPLPTDRPRPPVRSFRGADLPVAMSKETTEGLRELASREQATLFMTLLAAFQTLLWWYTSADDIVVGSPSAGRSRKETEALIGHFVNSLVLRTDLSGDPQFREVQRRVREVTIEALAHQDAPFERLVEELRPDRSLSYNPLFQVWFVFGDAERETISLKQVRISELEIETQVARHELQLTLRDSVVGLKGLLTYSTDLFDRETVARMAHQFETLLVTVVAQPDIRLSALRERLDQAEREYRKEVARSLEEASREKLKTGRRKSITAAQTVEYK